MGEKELYQRKSKLLKKALQHADKLDEADKQKRKKKRQEAIEGKEEQAEKDKEDGGPVVPGS